MKVKNSLNENLRKEKVTSPKSKIPDEPKKRNFKSPPREISKVK